ncbi:hypothetical protein [Caulobacter segnis]|nr:hypothetical protein [Caulobacter segnis]
MATLSPAARPDKADLDEAVAWLRILWKVPISNEDLNGFFAWSRKKPAARAIYDELSQRIHDLMMAEPPVPAPRSQT